MKTLNKFKVTIIVLISLSIIIAAILMAIAINWQPISVGKVHSSKDIIVSYNGITKKIDKFPHIIKTKSIFTMKINITDYKKNYDKDRDNTISFFSYSMKVRLIVDDKEIYSYLPNKNSVISGGYLLHLVKLPDVIKSDYVSIEFLPLLEHTCNYRVSAVSLGEKLTIISKNMLKDIVKIALAFFLVEFLVVVIVIRLFDKKQRIVNSKVYALGIFSGIIGVNFFTQIWTFNYFFRNAYMIIHMLEYISFISLLLPLFAMIKKSLAPVFDKWFNYAIIAGLININLHIVIVILTDIELDELYLLDFALAIIFVIIALVSILFTDGKIHKQKNIIIKTIFWSVLVILAGISAFLFFGLIYEDMLAMLNFIFIIFHIKITFVGIKNMESDRLKSEVYKELALRDSLTWLGNRHAYEKCLKKVSLEKKSFWIISSDLNNLKQINDMCGHLQGDIAIVNFANAIKNSKMYLHEIKYTAFRMGGDEFLIFIFAGRDFDVAKYIENIKRHVSLVSFECLELSVSLGACFYEYGTENIASAIVLADNLMYAEKMKLKKEHKSKCLDR